VKNIFTAVERNSKTLAFPRLARCAFYWRTAIFLVQFQAGAQHLEEGRQLLCHRAVDNIHDSPTHMNKHTRCRTHTCAHESKE